MSDTQLINILRTGLLDYSRALELQRELHRDVVAGLQRSTVIMTEHPAVITLGKNADRGFVLGAGEVPVIPTERGGEATAHEPGQIVAYPILRLTDFGLTPKRLVCLVEQIVIDVLADFGVESDRDPEHPGIWVKRGIGPSGGLEKIAAVGLRIKERVSLHGLALNVNNDLDTFGRIVPCGIRQRGVTTMSQVLGKPVAMSLIEASFAKHWASRLEVQVLQMDVSPRLQTRPHVHNMTP